MCMARGVVSTCLLRTASEFCDQWRESIRNHYKGQDCKITFNDDNCTIKDVDCADEDGGKGTDDKDTDTGEGAKEL